MSRIFVRGIGAVSPAGWGMEALATALAKGEPLATKQLPRPSGKTPHPVRQCPPAPARPSWLAHPRLRRSSAISQYAVAAAMEALQMGGIEVENGCSDLGIIVAVFSGCVQYSRRFYQEVLNDPSTASPLIFPETVFNAPASHLGAYLKCAAANYTLVGDTGTFLVGLATAAHWIQMGKTKHCLVVGTEEADWLTAEGLRTFRKGSVLAEGAGAVLLSGAPLANATEIQLAAVTDEILFTQSSRAAALRQVEDQLGSKTKRNCAVREVIGEGLMAASAWKVSRAIYSLLQQQAKEISICIDGLHQHAIGAKFAIAPA